MTKKNRLPLRAKLLVLALIFPPSGCPVPAFADDSGEKKWEDLQTYRKKMSPPEHLDPSLPNCGTDSLLGIPPTGTPPPEEGTPWHSPATWLRKIILPRAEAASTEVPATLEKRIQDCKARLKAYATVKTVTGRREITWDLVARLKDEKNGRVYEVWRDPKGGPNHNGILWADLVEGNPTYTELQDKNRRGREPCNKGNGLLAKAGIRDIEFLLPGTEDFVAAHAHGMYEVLPNLKNVKRGYWTSQEERVRDTSPPHRWQDVAHVFAAAKGPILPWHSVEDEGGGIVYDMPYKKGRPLPASLSEKKYLEAAFGKFLWDDPEVSTRCVAIL